jgi:prolyl oligopeptidase
MTPILHPAPPSSVDPVVDVLHGVSITDPYRWLEDQDSPRTREWIKEQTSYARAYLDSIPQRQTIRKRIEALLSVEAVSEPWKVGKRYVYLKREAHQEQPVIMMRECESCEEIVLVDPAARERSGAAVSIVGMSREGNILAYAVRYDGRDSQEVEFLDISTSQVLPERLPDGFGPGLVFSSDGLGFYYSHEISNPSRAHCPAVYWHKFGSKVEEDERVFVAGTNANLRVGLFGSADGTIVGYVVFGPNDPLTLDLYVQKLEGGTPQKVVERMDSLFSPFFVGRELFATTDLGAPNRRIVRIDLRHPEPEYWRDIVCASQLRIEDWAVVGNWICVSYFFNGCTRMQAIRATDRNRVEIPCPPNGIARLAYRPVETDLLFYEFSTFDQPPAIFSYAPARGEHKLWAQSKAVFDSSSIDLQQVHYRSNDGTEIPMYLVSKKERRRCNDQLPTLLTGYGGFGYSHAPTFKASIAFLMEQGFLFAVANLRGGGEFGEEWHLAGRRHNRQKSFDDFIAAAEWLLGNGYSDPAKLAISGGSNAGLLMGAAMTQRPDLFRAVVCSGPLLDMLRYHRFDRADRWLNEYGSADNPEDFSHLFAYSPYHRVQEGVRYPSVMLVSGDADTRCNPMHARKMAARLQAATSSGHPIILNYRPTWGHMNTQPLSVRIDIVTDRLAFICHELDIRM